MKHLLKLLDLSKEEILDILKDEGYPTYASILEDFDVNITNDPRVIAYLAPAEGKIVFNIGLDIDQVCTIARHEILHHYLKHEYRLLNKLAKEKIGKNLDEVNDLDELSLEELTNELKNELYANKDFNIAGDYEISNRGYTDRDKEIVRNIQLNGQTLSGLVTEDDHPEWVNMSIEEMYDELVKLRKEEERKAEEDTGDTINGALADPVTFVGADGRVYGI